MTNDSGAARPLLLSLSLAVVVFVALALGDSLASGAQARESLGLTRGPILDRLGRPLAFTQNVGGTGRRVYTVPDLATILGYRDARGNWHGLERKYSALLDSTRARRDWRTFFLHLRGQSVQGGRLRLTIDRPLQEAADAALGPHMGAVVVLQPQSGAVLAMVTRPYCPPAALATGAGYDRCLHDPSQPLLNRPTRLLLPPGSSFKIVTLTAALDTQRFNLSTVFSGADIFGPSPYFDNSTYPSNITRSDLTQLTLRQALAFSDNFTFAHIGLTLGSPTLLQYAHRYYIGRHIPFDFPVAVSSVANGNPHPTISELAQSSFGATVDHVSPLQMALIAETVANGGVMMAPHLVLDRETSTGRVLQRYHNHVLSRVMSRRAAQEVTAGMIFVVDHGSGFPAQIAGMKVAGKTGTAESGTSHAHAWFITFAPARHPVVAVAVLREFSGEGFQYAAPVARNVLVAALREWGYKVH